MKLWIGILGISLMGQTLTLEKERALGAAMAAEHRRHTKPLNIPDVSAFVERVGKRLAAALPGGEFRFEIVVAERTEPAGLPGGYVLVPASFLLAVEDEAEFAGMVAHAMGHVALRHGFVNLREGKEGTIPVFLGGGWMGAHADPRSLIPSGFLEAVRSRELEADRFGVDLAGRAGYDSGALARYIRRVQPETSAVWSALPLKGSRLAALEATTGRGGEVGGSEFLRVRELVRVALGGPVRKTPSLRR